MKMRYTTVCFYESTALPYNKRIVKIRRYNGRLKNPFGTAFKNMPEYANSCNVRIYGASDCGEHEESENLGYIHR